MAEPQAKTFAARLKTTRELQDLNQSELADKTGLTPAAVSQLESGDRLPAFRTIVTLANALGTSVGYLLGEENSEVPPVLRAVFRDLEDMNQEDIDKVKDYAAFLRQQAIAKKKK